MVPLGATRRKFRLHLGQQARWHIRPLAHHPAGRLDGTGARARYPLAIALKGILWARARATASWGVPVRGRGDLDGHIPQVIIRRTDAAYAINRLLRWLIARAPRRCND